MKRKPTTAIAATPLRRRAEARLGGGAGRNHAGNGEARSAADTQRLLHELQVHQVELEMQNEELQQARDEMEAGLEKYSDLYDFAPVGYLTLSREGVIREANLAGAGLLGQVRSVLARQNFRAFVSPADRPGFDVFLQQVFAHTARGECEIKLLLAGRHPVDVRLRANLSATGQSCQLAVTDITAQKLAANKVRVSEIRFRRLFETSHDGILLLDPGTRKITDANPFMTKLLGYPHGQLVGKELFEIGLLKDEAASQAMFQKLTRKHEVRYEDLPLESRGGRHQEVEVVANLYEEKGHAVIQCNIRDITARKQAEKALRLSEERYRTLFKSMDEGFCIIEMIFNRHEKPVDWRFLEVNPSFEKQNGLQDATGKRMSELASGLEPYWYETYGQVARTGKPVRFVNEAKALGGRWFDLYAFRVGGPDSRKVAIIFTNITERKRSEEALRTARFQLAQHAAQLECLVDKRTAELTVTNQRLEASLSSVRKSREENHGLLLDSQLMQKKLRQVTHQVLTAQEEERKKISRELHDEVVQMLVGINVELSALVHGNLAGVRHLKDKIAHTQRLVEKSVDSVHRFARELRPAVLDDLGLIPALHAYCHSLAHRKKIKIKLTAFSGVEALGDDKRTVLFRVAQEALTNIARHARASRVILSIRKHPGAIRMEIADNGKSFPVKQVFLAKSNKRLGLIGMKERVEMVGGSMTIESAPGKGTTIHVTIPFNQDKTNP